MINVNPWRVLMQQANAGAAGGPITIVDYGGFITPLDQSSITITGIQAGDFVIIAGASDSENMTVPSGWTQGYINNGSGTSAHGGYIYAFSTGTSITASSLSGTGTGGYSYAYIWQVFRGVNQSNPINAQAGQGSGGDSSPNPPAITTTVDGCMIVAMGMLDDDRVSSSVGAPTNFTLIYAQDADQYATCMTAYLLQETAGTIDPDSFQTSPDNRIAITVGLAPA